MAGSGTDGGFAALRVEGGLIPNEFLASVAGRGAHRQEPADYGLLPSFSLREELGRYWRLGSALHKRYLRDRVRQDRDARMVGVDNWLVPFCKRLLRYQDLTPSKGRVLDERTYRITHHSANGAVPFLLLTHELALDKAAAGLTDGGPKIAPHNMMQEYLNADAESLWGIVANGARLRIVRDNASFTRPAFIEADLDLMFQDELYADFRALWLIAHESRLKPADNRPSKCIIEIWRKKASEKGERAREQLREGVEKALKELGAGFLQHAENGALQDSLAQGAVTPGGYFKELLRLIYRLLFLFTAEDRNLLHAPDAGGEQKRLYEEGYSVARLRRRALRRRHWDRHSDLWQGLLVTFQGLARGEDAMALPALGGLFSMDHCAMLDRLQLSNRHLLKAVRSLAYFQVGSRLTRVNYRDMETEELGSVYESLLELYPEIAANGQGSTLNFLKGNKKKLTGSYYTPAKLVNELVKSTLEPVLATAIAKRPGAPREAILALKVLDPACGSGHFLLAAARRMARELARLGSDTGAYDVAAFQHALRDVMRCCVYGVDKNELAVELCKAALWIEAVEPGKPLNFLESRIRHGDSLLGVLNPELLEKGIPKAAYKPIRGDDKEVCSALQARNAVQLKTAGLQLSLFEEYAEDEAVMSASLADMPENTIDEINEKRRVWQEESRQRMRDRYPSNLFVGAFFARKVPETEESIPTTVDLRRVEFGKVRQFSVEALVEEIAEQHRFFHWHADLPEVMRDGGFDVIFANPPWELMMLMEKEFFASRAPRIASARNQAARHKLIEALGRDDASASDQQLFREYEAAKRGSEATSLFLREGGRFPLTGIRRINTYAVFAETVLNLLKPTGRAGMIVPTGIATDYSTQEWFRLVVESGRLHSLYDFENRRGIFRGVHKSYKFSLVTIGGTETARHVADYAFYLQDVEDLADDKRHIHLSAADFALFNPNTGTCPIFRSRRDLEVARKMYGHAGVLWRDASGDRQESNPWGIRLQQMFNMASDSRLFRTREELLERGYTLEGNMFVRGQERYMPLYEAKLFHQYDHRFATFDGVSQQDRKKGRAKPLSSEEKQDPGAVPIPRYWLDAREVAQKLTATGPVASQRPAPLLATPPPPQ